MKVLQSSIRFLVIAVTVALLPVVVAGEAHAQTTTYQTRVRLVETGSVYRYDETITLRGWVEVYDPTACDTASDWCTVPDTSGGSITVTRRLAGTTESGVIATRSNESDFTVDTASRGTAVYTVSYSGAHYDPNPNVIFGASSAARGIDGSRNPHGKAIKHDGALWFVGTVTPDWQRREVTIQKKSCRSCRWKQYRVVRTNRDGYYYARISAPRRGKWFWRSTVKPTEPRFVRAYSGVWSTFR